MFVKSRYNLSLAAYFDSPKVFDEVEIEPSDTSVKKAIDFAIDGNFDGFISLGGGSGMLFSFCTMLMETVIDTTKIVNLYSTYPVPNFTDYILKPYGAGKTIPGQLKPHISCPTTCGTGST